MTREEIKSKKRTGDLEIVAGLLGISPGNARIIWQRPKSKKYSALEKALIDLIESRETLTKNYTTEE